MNSISGYNYIDGNPITVSFEDGIITSVVAAEEHIPDSKTIAPGLTDLQVNGYNGIDVNNESLLPESLLELTLSLQRTGVTTFCPTVITNSNAAIVNILSVITEACRLYPEINRSFGGIHLEGPFISPVDGPRGAHPAEFVCPPSWELFEKWQTAAEGRIKIVTLSPEWPEADQFISRCVKNGITVAIGHTDASPQRIRDAIKQGATLSTHLGNASHRMIHRHNNYIWEQLAADELYATMITDGFHIPDSLIKILLKVKGDKAMLISDSTMFAGMEAGNYVTHIGGNVVLTEEGKLHISGTPEVLAGAGLTILDGVNHLNDRNLCPMAQAWEMASVRPQRLLKTESVYGIAVGSPADLVLLDVKNKIEVITTIKAGEVVYERE